ncbi:putative reverse transcriptase domain-containing protein [Tanacetum coccineum]
MFDSIFEANNLPDKQLEHEDVVQFRRTSLTRFPSQSVRSSNAYALDSPYLLVLITGTSQSRQHEGFPFVTVGILKSDHSDVLADSKDKDGFFVNIASTTTDYKHQTLLTERNQKYEWSVEQEEAFQTLKNDLCDAHILSLPDGIEDFVVYYDASNQGLGCVLMQRGKLFSDYECDIRYHPGKANVVADALCRKERVKPRRVRAMARPSTESVDGKEDRSLYFMDRIWVPLVGDVRMDYARIYIDVQEARQGVPEYDYYRIEEKGDYTTPLIGTMVQRAKGTRLAHEYIQSSVDGWTKLDLKLVLETTDKVVLKKEKLKAARDRQKSYADKRRKPLEFEVGDQALLKVSPWKGVVHFVKKGKLALRYVGLFEILERIGRKCLADANLHMPLDEIKVNKTLCFVKEPVEIMEREIKKLNLHDGNWKLRIEHSGTVSTLALPASAHAFVPALPLD